VMEGMVVLAVTVGIMVRGMAETRLVLAALVVPVVRVALAALAVLAVVVLLVELVELVLPWEMQPTFFRRAWLTLPVLAGVAAQAPVPAGPVALVALVGTAMLETEVAMGVQQLYI
jgi:hypothetical protein